MVALYMLAIFITSVWVRAHGMLLEARSIVLAIGSVGAVVAVHDRRPSLNALICRAGGVCPPMEHYLERRHRRFWPGVHRWSAILQVVHRRFVARARAGGTATVVHIGANDLAADAQTKTIYDWLLKRGWRGRSIKLILVEPNPRILTALRRRVLSYGVDPENVQIVNAAMCSDRNTSSVPFFVFSSKMYADFPLEMLGKVQTESKARCLLDMLGSIDRESLARDLEGFHRSGWIRASPESILPYLEAVPLRCISPARLLRETRTRAANVDVLLVDSPRAPRLLSEFMALPSFSPAFARFHAFWGAAEVKTDVEGYFAGRGGASREALAVESLAIAGFNVYRSLDFVLAVANRTR
eukprot:TRINITY_DN62022_c0_g1_i1.p1 TRINITY_DN62022_c0_g1~~TRINITY_DN62022_c0_g1_i1.p1  ORF type:complete len:355 (+),score=36.06 TRINITY_DN62022_c0_g1_i1:54-1118(+)